MKISVIIPTYKPHDYLWKCLQSLNNQSLNKNEFEVILVLNGCNEPYNSQIRQFINENLSNCQVNYFQIDMPGVSNARNVALDCAKGEYITFIDDDDYVSPAYLEKLYEKASPEVVSLSNAVAINEPSEIIDETFPISKIYKTFHNQGLQSLWTSKKYFSGPWMKLIHKDIIGDRRFDVNFTIGEDSQFMFLISDRIKSVDFSSDDAIYYRVIREGSAITSINNKVIIGNLFKTIPAYTKVYVKGFPHYNLCFYLSRILGAAHSLMMLKF